MAQMESAMAHRATDHWHITVRSCASSCYKQCPGKTKNDDVRNFLMMASGISDRILLNPTSSFSITCGPGC